MTTGSTDSGPPDAQGTSQGNLQPAALDADPLETQRLLRRRWIFFRPLNAAVVGVVALQGAQGDEERLGVDDATDAEPEQAVEGDHERHADAYDE